MVKVRDGGDVPGTAGQRKRLESAEVAGDVGDDHFYDLVWEGAGRYVRNGCLWRRTTKQTIDLGFASAPNDLHTNREVHPYGTKGVEVRDVYAH